MQSPATPRQGMSDATAMTTRRAATPAPPESRSNSGPEVASPAAVDTLAAAMVDALAVAWTTYRVYADPRPQDAFRRAVATLGTPPGFPWIAAVHSSGFRFDGRPIPTRRQAASTLTRAAFARGIAALGFSSPPTPDDLLCLFEVISQRQGSTAEAPGPTAALAAKGAATVIIIEHGRLRQVSEERGHDGTADAAEDSAHPSDAQSGDPARRYLDEYRLLYERLRAGGLPGLQELVHDFTDCFFALPRDQQIRLFEQFLARHEEEPFRLLLDQFSQDDLAELGRLLSPGTHPLLVEYARIAAEQEGQSGDAAHMLSVEQLVAGRISGLLPSAGEAVRRQLGDALRAQVPGPEGNFAAATAAADVILSLANEAGYIRVARAVAAKTTAAVAEGDLRRAAAWGHVLLSGAPSRERKEVVRREVEDALRPEILDRLFTATELTADLPPTLVTLLTLFGLDPIIECLAAEEDMGRRRSLVSFLTSAARTRPGPLIRRLNDPRWFLVRNLVDALAHSGRTEAAAGVRAACSHPDSRVRREARRALPLLDEAAGTAAAIEGLQDREPGLRLQAIGLLRTAPAPDVERGLAALLASRPAREERLAAVTLLAARRTQEAHTLLLRLARRRPFARRARRDTRRAAREALAGRS